MLLLFLPTLPSFIDRAHSFFLTPPHIPLQTINEKRTQLQPAIREMRNLRTEFAEVEAAYLKDKAVYDNTRSSLEGDIATLSKEADALQEDAMNEESRYHSLQIQLALRGIAADRAKSEADCEAGSERYLREFKTRKEVYANKGAQLETLAKELRKKQRDIKENLVANAAQRTRFLDLRKLLQAKVVAQKSGEGGGSAAAASLLAGDALTFEETAGANVMVLER